MGVQSLLKRVSKLEEARAHNQKLLGRSRALKRLTIAQLRAKWCRLQDEPDFPLVKETFGEFMEVTRHLLQKLEAKAERTNHGR